MIPIVKKLLLIFLLAVLPLQYAWAAAAVYCQHEQEQEHSMHVGHHSHQHDEVQVDADDKPGDTASLEVDTDCVTCHGGAVGIATVPFASPPYKPLVAANAAQASLLASPLPLRPERPKWSLAA
jgi:hypothetical protein